MGSYLQVSLLPWANQDEIQIGDVIFWPFDPLRISDLSIRNYLDKYSKCYVDFRGQIVDSITVASYKNKSSFSQLTTDEYFEIKNTRDILCFLSIASQVRDSVGNDNNSIVPPSAEVFEMVCQNFTPGVEDIAIRAGNMLSGGWKLNEIKFTKPLATGGTFRRIEVELLKGFNNLLKLPVKDEFRNRILRSLEWFRMAHYESDEVSTFSKVVMMATAFEILLDFPPTAKSEFFSDRIDEYIATKSFKLDSRPYKKTSRTLSIAGWWGWDFYKLRNAVVHGSEILPTDLVYRDWVTHPIVADIVFLRLIIHQLMEKGLLKGKVKSFKTFSTLDPLGNKKEILKEFLNTFCSFSNAFEKLKWV